VRASTSRRTAICPAMMGAASNLKRFALVPRTEVRTIAAGTVANFGSKAALESIMLLVSFDSEVSLRGRGECFDFGIGTLAPDDEDMQAEPALGDKRTEGLTSRPPPWRSEQAAPRKPERGITPRPEHEIDRERTRIDECASALLADHVEEALRGPTEARASSPR